MKVTGLYRYAIKGLSGDSLDRVFLQSAGETFPDDRRFALLRADKQWNGKEWLHKENFLCAFTEPELLSQLETSYCIRSMDQKSSRGLPCDSVSTDNRAPERILTVRDRKTGTILVDSLDLERSVDRQRLAAFLSKLSSQAVRCVTSEADDHNHQFGNTSSGVKHRGDTRTIHIVNEATIRELSNKIDLDLNPSRFRPNVVVQGPAPWSEFDWIGKSLIEPKSGLQCTVINKTVRCKGVSVDPLDMETILDIPKLLVDHFPQHGPYLGIYAVVDTPGSLGVGDELRLN